MRLLISTPPRGSAMPSHRRKLLPLCIAASLLTGLSMDAAAIGVGEIHLQSFLGAPLQADVPLNHLGDLSADQLKVELASQSDYSSLGVEYNYLHSQLKIEPIIKNGQGFVRISTRDPIAEPYLNFVLSLRWPQGQLVREFTVLLDPPTQAAVTAVAANVPVATDSVAAAPEAAAPRKPRHSQRRPVVIDEQVAGSQVEAPAVAAKAAARGDKRYTIRRGDSLWRIANRARSPQVPVEQVMAAIQAANPNAFIDGNPNLLKEASVIALPDTEQIAATNSASAATATAAVTSTAASAVTPAATAAAPAEQLVEENSVLKGQVADLTSNVASLNASLVQSEQRMHQLESQLNDLITQMQQQRATVAAMSGNAETQNGAAQSGGSVISQVNASELHDPAKAHTPWWVHLLYWLGIGGVATWAIREHFWPQRRLAAAAIGAGSLAVDEEKSTHAPQARAAAPASIKSVADAAELSLDLDELPPPVAASNAQYDAAPSLLKPSDEAVDISISAGVFVAFGRFDEAEQLLREAIAREPLRTDLKLQLLDVLMQSDQPGAFDDLAEEVEREARSPEVLAELAVLRDSYRPMP